MNGKTALVVVISTGCFACSLCAGYVRDREAAVALVLERKYAEAFEAFGTMAQEPGLSDFQKSDALREAALCAIRLRRYEEANEIADTIPTRAVGRYCRMQVLANRRQWQDLITEFKDENLDAWPDYVARTAFRVRGDAYYHRKLGSDAVKDYLKALEFPHEHGRTRNQILSMLGAAYHHLLEDDARAVETYRQICGAGTVKSIDGCFATTALARIYSGQGEHGKALSELERIDMNASAHPHLVKPHTLQACGDVLSAAGRADEAARRYEEALQVKGIQAHVKAACERGLEALREAAE